MKSLLIIATLLLFLKSYSQLNTDSLDKANAGMIRSSGKYITKARIEADSSIWLQANIRLDHRFFGYAKPDIHSKRLILFSVFTNDVEHNPFGCRYGSYYETSGMADSLKLVFAGYTGNFIRAKLVNTSQDDQEITSIYFEKKWFASAKRRQQQ